MNNLMAKVIASIVFIKFIKIILTIYYAMYTFCIWCIWCIVCIQCIALHTIYAMYMKVIVVVLPKFRGYSEYYFLHHWPNNGNNGKANFHFFCLFLIRKNFTVEVLSLSLQQAFSSYQRYPRRKKNHKI